MSFSKAPVKRFNERDNSPSSRNASQNSSQMKLHTEHLSRSSSYYDRMNCLNSQPPSLPKPETKSSQRALSTSSRASSARCQTTKKSQITGPARKRTTKFQQRVQKEKYIKLKKELKAKEAGLLELFETMLKLRAEMINDGIKDIEIIEQLKILDAGCLGEGGDPISALHKSVNVTRMESECLSSLEAKLKSLSSMSFDFCQKAVDINNHLISTVSHTELEKLKVSDSGLLKVIESLKKEGHSLIVSLEKIKKSHAETMGEVLANVSALIQERDSVKDNKTEHYNEHILKIENEKNAIIERLKKEILKAKNIQAETDNALHSACKKVKEMESKVSAQEMKIKSFCTKMMKFENLLRSRNRVQNMRFNNVLVTSKVLKEENELLQEQKQNLQLRFEDLKDILKRKEKEQVDEVNKLNYKIDHLTAALSAQKSEQQKLQKERDTALQQKNEMEEKLLEMTETTDNMMLQSSDSRDSKSEQHEQQLQEELESTRELLQSTQQALESVQQEKANTEQALKDAMKHNQSDDKLVHELMESRNKIAVLNKNLKNLTIESEKKSKTIIEMKRKLQDSEQISLKPGDYNKIHGAEIKHKMLQMESMISHLRQNNAELQKQMLQLNAELENKVSKDIEKTKILGAKDEELRKLKVKERKQAEKISNLVLAIQEHESAASFVQQDISTKGTQEPDVKKLLEVRQLQVLRLEKLLHKQEEQMNRWSLQRTRHEARIAELEKALRERQRITKFPFSCARSTPVK